jgi:hypothetical protein
MAVVSVVAWEVAVALVEEGEGSRWPSPSSSLSAPLLPNPLAFSSQGRTRRPALHDAGDVDLSVRAAAWEGGAGEAAASVVLAAGEHEESTDEEASATPWADKEAGGEGPGMSQHKVSKTE